MVVGPYVCNVSDFLDLERIIRNRKKRPKAHASGISRVGTRPLGDQCEVFNLRQFTVNLTGRLIDPCVDVLLRPKTRVVGVGRNVTAYERLIESTANQLTHGQ